MPAGWAPPLPKKTAAQKEEVKRVSGEAGRKAYQKFKAADTSNYQAPSRSTGGGGGALAAPVSTLASLPQTPELQALIQAGIIREGMPPEQALALLAIAKIQGGVGVNVQALMDQITADYARTSGDINTASTDWLQQIMGQNMPTGDMAALYAQDPMWANSAANLAQMNETAGLNEATDLAWFTKNQQAYQDYYNSLMAGISSGAVPIGAAATGGGGGSGGGRGYGGGGGGGSSGDGNLGFTDTKTAVAANTEDTNTRTDQFYANWPGFYTDMLAQIGDPVIRDQVESLLNQNPSPEEFLSAAEQLQIDLDTSQERYRGIMGPEYNGEDLLGSNEIFDLEQKGLVEQAIRDYEELTGQRLGDDPLAPGNQQFYQPPGTTVNTEMDEADRARRDELLAIIEPALTAGGDLTSPVARTRLYNSVGYLRDLAGQRLANQQQPNNQSMLDWKENLIANQQQNTQPISTGTRSSVANSPWGGHIPSSLGNYNANVGPNIPMGTEVPVHPDDINEYYEETGSFPWTPLTDDPNAPGRPSSNPFPIPGVPPSGGGGNSGTIPPAGTPEYQQYLAQAGQNMPGQHAANPYRPTGGGPLDDLRMQQNANTALLGPGQQQGGTSDSARIQQLLGQYGTSSGQVEAQRLAQTVLANARQSRLASGSGTGSDLFEALTGHTTQDYENAASDLGYTKAGSDAANYVDPEAIASMLQEKFLGDPETGLLREPIQDVRREAGYNAWLDRITGMSDEQANTIDTSSGQWYIQPDTTEEEYARNEQLLAALPLIMETSKGWNTNITFAQRFARLQQMLKEQQTNKQTATSYDEDAARSGALGPSSEFEFEDLNSIELEDEANYAATGGMGASLYGAGLGGAGLGNLLTGSTGANKIDDLLRKSAQKRLAAPVPTSAKPKPTANIKAPTGKKPATTTDVSKIVTALKGAQKLAKKAKKK